MTETGKVEKKGLWNSQASLDKSVSSRFNRSPCLKYNNNNKVEGDEEHLLLASTRTRARLCVCTCLFVCVHVNAGPKGQRRVLDPLKMELHAVLSTHEF